jgi:fructokinase
MGIQASTNTHLALALVNFICTLSPKKLILGAVRWISRSSSRYSGRSAIAAEWLRAAPAIVDEIGTYIVPPGLGGDVGVLGSLAMWEEKIARSASKGF